MKKFSEFGLKQEVDSFTGNKIAVSKILNRDIIIHDYKIVDSNFSGKCLYLQIEFNNEKRVVFTGSKYLLDTIEKIPKDGFPFNTIIIEEDGRFEFS